MRFEGKHNYFKKYLNNSSNFVNIPQTLAVKYQINLANFLLNFDFDKKFPQKYGEKSTHGENTIEKIIVYGKVLKKGIVFESFDENNHLTQLKKIEKITQKDEKNFYVVKL
jgi:hypothetical protein